MMAEELMKNISLKSLSEEELNEQMNYKKDNSNVSSKCVFARWLKPASVSELRFVSKDVLLVHVEKTLIFYDTNTRKEDIRMVGSKVTPGDGGDDDDDLLLEGIGCVDCCNDTDLLALADLSPISKVVICLYPDLKVLATLIDSSCSAAYKSIRFLRLEYLIGLRDYPAFDLIVWAWRIGEKLLVVDTGFIQPNQYLNLSSSITSASGRNNVYLSQTEHDVRCELQLWTLFVGCKTVYAGRTRVKMPTDASASGCWTPYGWYVFCDSSANVYRVQPDAPEPEMVLATTGPTSARRGNGDDGGRGPSALVCPSKQGFVVYELIQDNRLTCFKDTKGVFTKIWTMVVNCTLLCMAALKNDVYCWSDKGTLLRLTQKNLKILNVHGSKIKYFTFIKPTDETVATINHANILQVWDALTGELKSTMKLNGTATDLCCNPFYCYIAITFKNGKMELLRTVPKENEIECIAKMVLCDEDLSSVKFFSDGNICGVTCFPTGRFYYISITLGQKCAVLREHRLGKCVIDVDIIDNQKSSFLTVLCTDLKNAENVGNNIIIFDMDFNIVFEIKDVQNDYTSVFKWSSCSVSGGALNIAFTVFHSFDVHLMTIDIVRKKVLESQTIPLNHQLRSIKTYTNENYCVTYSPDGSYNIYEFEDDGQWKQIIMVNCSDWRHGGLIAAQVDANGHNILTLSHQGNFMCTSFKGNLNRNRRIDTINIPIVEYRFETEGIGFEDGPESPKRMTWEMIDQQNQLNASIAAYSDQKQQISQDFEKIKTELRHLLETNVNGPEDMKIDIKEFDLNVDYTLSFREKCKLERKEYEEKILSDINKFKMETENIIKEKWETLFIKPKSIHCLKNFCKVDNYPISIMDQDIIQKANKIIEQRILIRDMSVLSKNYQFSNNSKVLEVESNLSESDFMESNDLSMMGSISHEFVENIDTLNTQLNYYKLEMAEDEIILLEFIVNTLKHKFNQLFDDLITEKQQQLNNLNEYNARLRVIESEMRLACKVEPTEPSPVDYKWNKYEQTEKLLHVSDEEVLLGLYNKNILFSNETSYGANSGAAERNSESVILDDFRERALMVMMDGVLEKKWEDELKKDLPKPECIELGKNPEDFTIDDFRAIAEYEKLIVTLNDDRIKYKKILDEEKIKIQHHIAQIIEKLDNNIFALFKTKVKYNSAINDENAKMCRLSKMLSDSDQRKHQIKQHNEIILELKETITGIEQIIEETNKKIVISEPNSLLSTIETLNHKNTNLNERFKSKFPSKQALIAYNRRPKLQGNKNYSSILGYQFINTIMDPTDDKLHLLTPEFVKYLNALRVYDDYKYVVKHKLNMGRKTWHKLCNFRGMKIETEFKISTCQKDAKEKNHLLNSLKSDKQNKGAMIEKLKTDIVRLENQDLNYKNNPKIQLVVPRGNIEAELTGHFSDFKNTLLISKNVIDEVNAEIKKMGNTKISALSNLLKFERKSRLFNWKHDILKNHEIPLNKFRFDYITSMKITENILNNYLKFKLKGISNTDQAAEQNLRKVLAAIEFTFTKQKENLNEKLNEMYKAERDTKTKNKKVDEDIEQLTCELTELRSVIDYSLNDKLKLSSDQKIKDIMKCAEINRKSLELHKEIEALEVELELLLHRTSPTLDSNFPKNAFSISK